MFTRNSLRRSAVACAAVLVAMAGMATPASAATALEEVSGSGHGTILRSVSTPGAPLLARFAYHFTGGDHHIRQVTAMPLPQQSAVEVAFADGNGDDDYSYRVSHERTDATGIVQATFHDTCAGECTRPLLTRPAGDFVFVLAGFRLSYDSVDHHLDKIAISESGSFLTTSFKDLNGDDPFTYDVSYAWVPRSRLGTLGSVQNTVHGVGTSSNFAGAGEKVIRGFFMDNLASGVAGDNNIRDLGVVANADTIDVTYGDNNPGDSADWGFQVQYATVL